MPTEREQPFNPLENLWEGIQKLGGPVIAHAHLDRADTMTRERWRYVNATLQEKWFIVDEVKKTSSEDQIYDRMMGVVEKLHEQEGTKVIGSFIDVDAVIGCKAIKAADRLREAWKGSVDFIFINQTLKGVLDSQAFEWFKIGAEWADIVGGLPGKDKPHQKEHIQVVLDTAKKLGKMAHVHVDQFNDCEERETELLAQETLEAQMQGKVVAVHAISLGAHPRSYREDVYKLMQDAELMTISCPTAWLNSRRKEQMQVSHNAVTPVDEFGKFGIICGMGPDNICDVYMPFTQGYMKTELQVLLEATHHYNPDDLALIATVNGLKTLGLLPHDKS